MVRELLGFVDFFLPRQGREGGRGQMVVQPPSYVFGIGLAALAPPGVAGVGGVGLETAVHIDQACAWRCHGAGTCTSRGSIEQFGQPGPLRWQKAAVFHIAFEVFQIRLFVRNIDVSAQHQLTLLADRHGWRLVLVGDPYQLPAVGRGGMFAELAQHTNPIELARVRRFTSDWEGPASLALRRADPGVVATYEHHGRIQPGTFDEHADQITSEWLEHTGLGRTVAVTAATNEEVDRLNTAIQTARLQLGQLDTGRAVAGGGGDRLHPGDVVATRQNRRDLTTDRGVMVKNRAQWTITHTHPTGEVTLTGPDGTITLPGDYTRDHVRLAYAATVYGTQGATVDRSITLVSGATDHRNLYVGATRGRHMNQFHVIADTVEDARDVLEAALGRDRVDTPAVSVRRDLLHQAEVGRTGVVGAADRTPATTIGIPDDTDQPAVLIAGRTPDTPDLDGTDPFAGLETVGEALERVLAEQAERNAPRERFSRLQGELAQARYDREQLDKPRGLYVRTPLDEAHRAVNNAHADISMLTTRYQHTGWRQRRAVGRDLEHARERLETAKARLEEQYEHHVQRLDQTIDTVTTRLEQLPQPEPVGPRDRQLEQAVGWFRWETSVGNNDRPTLEALEEHKAVLDRVGDRRRLASGEWVVHQVVTIELDDRGLQHRQAVVARESALARLQTRSVGRDLGPDLGL